jgi:endonuclease/exonuclease/phosphatase family metal-dependent hydrolase
MTGQPLTLLSWNVLADAYVRPEYFPGTPPALLAPGARTPALVERLVASAADVICLQEVEAKVFAAAREGLGAGYAAHFLGKGLGKPDGCATFVRRDRLDVAAVRALPYAEAPSPSGHVALLLTLRAGAQAFGVATTHVKWDSPGTASENRWATRQLGALVAALEPTLPWLVCGDLNLGPEDEALGILRAAGLRDAYAGSAHVAPTANSNGRARRIDYVFASPALLAEPLPLPAIDGATPLPSATQPSDHLCIGVRFDFSAT